ncbi:MAG: DHH family phosphoesterase [Candidatus Aminicenantes bacterium]|nr:DHH family phosphoesterase [Candidatus Aminicenantes bacterium]
MTTKPVDDIVRKIRDCRRLAITSHLRPDGDSLCSGLALVEAFELMGKTADYVITDPIPVPFNVFPECRRIRIGQIASTGYNAVVLLECADVSRSGQTGLDGYYKINIDHHYSNSHYADINWVDAEAPAVAELVLDLCEAAGITLTPRIANHLYCAIVSDTGSFQFSNTTARAFAACHKLVSAGAQPIETSEALFHNNRPEKVILLGRVLSTLRLNPAGTIAQIGMFRKDLIELNLREVDTEDITTLARSIMGVRVVLFFKEMEPDVFRVSIRSKGSAHAAAIAEHFGGGGHAHAAGFTVYGPFARVSVEVMVSVEALLAAQTGSSGSR